LPLPLGFGLSVWGGGGRRTDNYNRLYLTSWMKEQHDNQHTHFARAWNFILAKQEVGKYTFFWKRGSVFATCRKRGSVVVYCVFYDTTAESQHLATAAQQAQTAAMCGG
jgi:hypothetical protein